MAKSLDFIFESLLQFFKTGDVALSGHQRKRAEVAGHELLAYLAAAADHPGLVELATAEEAAAGTDTARAVTPAGLAAALAGGTSVPDASTTTKGKVELATDAETRGLSDTARAVTPKGLAAAMARLSIICFQGVAAPGPCSATGLVPGDMIVSVTTQPEGGDLSASFESVVTVANQIQQTDESDLSSKPFWALVYRI